MPIELHVAVTDRPGDLAKGDKVGDTLLLTFIGELKRDADRKIMPAYVAIELSAKDLAVGNLADLPRLLRQKATRVQEKLNQLTAGSREVTLQGGIIKE